MMRVAPPVDVEMIIDEAGTLHAWRFEILSSRD